MDCLVSNLDIFEMTLTLFPPSPLIFLFSSILNKEYVSHGEKVVKFMSQPENKGLLYFESTWRQNFIVEMKPQFLPKMWSSSHGHERIAMDVSNLTDESERQRLSIILGLL